MRIQDPKNQEEMFHSIVFCEFSSRKKLQIIANYIDNQDEKLRAGFMDEIVTSLDNKKLEPKIEKILKEEFMANVKANEAKETDIKSAKFEGMMEKMMSMITDTQKQMVIMKVDIATKSKEIDMLRNKA